MYRALCCGVSFASCSRSWAVMEVVDMGSGTEEVAEEEDTDSDKDDDDVEDEEEEEEDGVETVTDTLFIFCG